MHARADEDYIKRLELKARYIKIQELEARQRLSEICSKRERVRGEIHESHQNFQSTLRNVCSKRIPKKDPRLARLELSEQLILGQKLAQKINKLRKKDSKIKVVQAEAQKLHSTIKIKDDQLSEAIEQSRRAVRAHKNTLLDESIVEQAVIRNAVTETDSLDNTGRSVNAASFEFVPILNVERGFEFERPPTRDGNHPHQQPAQPQNDFAQQQAPAQQETFQTFKEFESRIENLNSRKKGDNSGLDLTYVAENGDKALMHLQTNTPGNIEINIIPLTRRLERKLVSIESKLGQTLLGVGLDVGKLKIGSNRISSKFALGNH